MFWKINFRPPSAIDTLLNEEQCSLNDILDEDNVLQELKSQNKKLVDFFVKPEILEQLVRMVTTEPEDDAEDKVKFKYPHLSCELLTCEAEAVVNSLSESEQLLNMLWAFLDRDDNLDPLLGSFTSAVLNMLLNQKCSVIFDYVRDKEGFVNLFLNHLGTSAIMDLLLQMVAAPSNDQIRLDLAEWFKEEGIVEKLVDFIHPSTDAKKCANASQALCEILRVSRESSIQMVGPTPLLGTLESEVTMKRLLDNVFCSDTPSDIVIISGVSVLLTAIDRRQPNALSPAMNATFVGDENSVANSLQATQAILGVIIPRMKQFNDLLLRPPNVLAMPTSAGTLDPPLGNTRLQVVKLFCALLQCNDSRVNRRVAELNTFSILMELFFKFPWNNFLHTQVEGCVSAAVASPPFSSSSTTSLPPLPPLPPPPSSTPTTAAPAPADDPSKQQADSSSSSDTTTPAGTTNVEEKSEGNNDTDQDDSSFSLKYHVLHDCHLVQRLLEGDESNQKLSSEPRGRRQGYMGHLMKMVNLLVRCGETDPALGAMIRDTMAEDIQQRWTDFLSGSLADSNRKNETNLGGNRPVTSSLDDSDDEFDQMVTPDNELDKAYQRYQEVKYVPAMVEEFGADDDLRANEELYSGTFTQLMNIGCVVKAEEIQTETAALFEAACAEKIQQFDDSESDEEESSMWADRDVTFTSPPIDRQSSMSSDEEDGTHRQREFQTSFEDDSTTPTHQQPGLGATATPGLLSQITGRSGGSDDSNMMDISSPYNPSASWQTPEDLSGVTPMDTGGGISEWREGDQNQPSAASPSQSSWADFSSFSQSSPQVQENSVHGAGDHTPQSGNNVILSPPSRDTSQYSVIGASPNQGMEEPPGGGEVAAVDMENVQLTVMDDIRSPDSPQVPRHSTPAEGNGGSSSEEGDSSGSDEDRSGQYVLNASSDGDHLLESPEQSPKQPPSNSPKSDTTSSPTQSRYSLPSNGLGNLTEGSGTSLSESGAAKPPPPTSNSHDHLSDGLDAVTTTSSDKDTATELSDNFEFLSKQGLIRDAELTEEQRVEKKRLEALEACKQYDQEVQGSKGVDVS